ATDQWHAIILAHAGLERLGLRPSDGQINFEGSEFFTALLPREIFLPAGGQGVIAMQIRSGDEPLRELVDAITDFDTRLALRAKERIERADVIVYDHLANPEMLGWARDDAEIVYAGKKAGEHALTQDEINELLVEKARAGREVVRLKGGDPFVFGRGAEEAKAIVDAGIALEIVPGIT